MRLHLACAAACALAFNGVAAHAATNLLSNPGFEAPITYDGAPFVGSWEGFNGSAGSFAVNSTTTPRTGAMDLNLSITTANDFAGAFQDVTGLSPGTALIYSGYHRTPSNPFGVVVEYRIEWRNSVSNTEVSRNQLNATPTAAYTPFSLTATVPAGADTARVVYDIESFGTPGPSGAVFADDFSLSVVPEPTSIAALGAASLLLGRKRR